jgi:hypothetical protein
MNNVYFFSRHEAQQQMVYHLGGINQQFKGTISGVKRVGDNIEFQELPLGETTPVVHTIPFDSVIVTVAPLPIQEAWLKAGVSLLLAPQTKRQATESGETVFLYAGLLRIKRIIVDTEQWAGAPVSLKDKHSERSAM